MTDVLRHVIEDRVNREGRLRANKGMNIELVALGVRNNRVE